MEGGECGIETGVWRVSVVSEKCRVLYVAW